MLYEVITVIPVYFFFNRYVPKMQHEKLSLTATTKWDKKAFLLMLMTFFIGIAYIGATIKIPSLLVSRYHYSSFFASNMLTVLAFSGILIGLVFGKITKLLKEKTMLLMVIMMGLGNLMFTVANHSFFFLTGAFLIGASFVGGMSSVFNYIARHYAKHHVNFITSLAITAGNIGVILTPLLLTKLPAHFHLEAFMTPFYMASGLMVLNVMVYQLLPKTVD